MDKIYFIQTIEHYLTLKKEGSSDALLNMNLENIML